MNEIRQQILEWIARDEKDLIRFFSQLVQCKSPNPPGDTTAAMRHVQHFLKEQNLAYREVNARDTWPNMIASFDTGRPGRHLMFNGHLDVFPASNQPGWTDDPWSGKVADGRIWGRGTGDMKAGLTASIFAYAYLSRLRDQLKGKISLTVVSDEENGGEFGVGYMFKKIEQEMSADCVISGESTTPRGVAFGGKGNIQFIVQVATPGAHASAPFKSANAIRIASDIIRDLDDLASIPVHVPEKMALILNDPKVQELMGAGAEYISKTTLNAGTIHGGAKVNVIASDCAFEFEARIPIGVDPDAVVERARAIVARYPEAVITSLSVAPPDYCDPTAELATVLQDTVESLGRPRPVMFVSSALSDCKYWRDRGIPAFWYGPTPVAGTANESVSIDEFLNLVRVHSLAAARYLCK
ncbi:M20/M25/M40 family metallo-hydrolase [Mesorhizobium sp. 1B3]|uniref:M20/M25/M40 family metallo-hydrolase n=1 Tax=Mesorhizobium sp. 1B3 TaxID=3243599 RepID=UPI003D98D31D